MSPDLPEGTPTEMLLKNNHGHHFLPTIRFFKLLQEHGYLIAAQEFNPQSISDCCTEFVLIRS